MYARCLVSYKLNHTISIQTLKVCIVWRMHYAVHCTVWSMRAGIIRICWPCSAHTHTHTHTAVFPPNFSQSRNPCSGNLWYPHGSELFFQGKFLCDTELGVIPSSTSWPPMQPTADHNKWICWSIHRCIQMLVDPTMNYNDSDDDEILNENEMVHIMTDTRPDMNACCASSLSPRDILPWYIAHLIPASRIFWTWNIAHLIPFLLWDRSEGKGR